MIRIINTEFWLPVTSNRKKQWGIVTALLARKLLIPNLAVFPEFLLVSAQKAIFENTICNSFCTS
jgi:hypothetical protein